VTPVVVLPVAAGTVTPEVVGGAPPVTDVDAPPPLAVVADPPAVVGVAVGFLLPLLHATSTIRLAAATTRPFFIGATRAPPLGSVAALRTPHGSSSGPPEPTRWRR
jgi:hypothetical protein